MTATNLVVLSEYESKVRDNLKREIAARHALTEFGARDPSMWQWAKAYDYVEATFGRERTEVLRSLAKLGRERRRPRAAPKAPESSSEASFA